MEEEMGRSREVSPPEGLGVGHVGLGLLETSGVYPGL